MTALVAANATTNGINPALAGGGVSFVVTTYGVSRRGNYGYGTGISRRMRATIVSEVISSASAS